MRCAFFHARPTIGAHYVIGARQTHYDTLHLSQDASPKEVKSSFYELSKKYHPDHNPEDKSARNRFHKINDAYTVLSNAERRRRYDRELQRPTGSSTSRMSAAGGRPASGLSRRRTRPQGPPPSYRAPWRATSNENAYTAEAPHFNHSEHYRQHYAHERKRQEAATREQQRADAARARLADQGFWARFASISLVVAAIYYITGGISSSKAQIREIDDKEMSANDRSAFN